MHSIGISRLGSIVCLQYLAQRRAVVDSMGKTNMPKPSPKKAQSSPRSSSSKVPKPSELCDAKVSSGKSERLADRDVHIFQVPFCDDGSVYGDHFSGELVGLHLLQE